MNRIDELQKKMYADGVKVEDYFIELAKRDGYECRKSTRYQDRWEHWDVELIKDGKSGRIDVKGYKESHKHGLTWIEFKNVSGDDGWIYGKAHAIAFEREDIFDLINRVKLKKFVDNKIINKNGLVYKKEDDLSDMIYQNYNRVGRKDVVVIVPFVDIDKFIMKTIYK